jgi:hypothetical protein
MSCVRVRYRLLPLVWRGCEATTREQIYLLLLELAANTTFSKQDAQIVPYFVFTVFIHYFPKFLPKSQRRVAQRSQEEEN